MLALLSFTSSSAGHLRALLAGAAFLVLAAAPPPAAGQTPGFPYTLGSADAALGGIGLGLSVVGEALGSGSSPLLAEVALLDRDQVNPFDRVATRYWSTGWADASDWSRNLLLGTAGAVVFLPEATSARWGNGVTLGALFAETYLILRGATYSAKHLTRRNRPYLHNTDLSPEDRHALAVADGQDSRASFYSGHAAGTFAVAALLSTVYTDIHGRSTASDALWAGSLSLAAFTGFARVRAGKHYPSDVLVGAAVGTAVGMLVPRLHRRGGSPSIRVVPSATGLLVSVPLP